VVALGTLLTGQAIAFLHAGDELLRSKAMDGNSFNSGDWFNRIDWSQGTNYLASFGLPPAAQNQASWSVIAPVLANASAAPAAADIAATSAAVLDLLRVRSSTTMLRLRTAAQVQRCVSFPDAQAQQDGLIVMRVGRSDHTCGDGAYRNLVVLINANRVPQTFALPALAGHALGLHPAQANGADPVVRQASFAATGTFAVPARTVAVFIEP